MSTRRQHFEALIDAVGAPAHGVQVDMGWPGDVVIELADGAHADVALHVSRVLGLTSGAGMARGNAGEIRFQNPGQAKPMAAGPGQLPLLVGWEPGPPPVTVVADAARRLGLPTRFSVRFPDALVLEAQLFGAAEYVSTSGEVLTAVTPALLPVVVQALRDGLALDIAGLQAASAGAGLVADPADVNAGDRARKAAAVLVRDARFRRDVLQAYMHRCAICRVGLGVVVAAHVHPVSAVGSTDDVNNGVALCQNHHVLYDKHMLALRWEGLELRLLVNPSLATGDAADDALVSALPTSVFQPGKVASRVKAANVEARHAHFGDSYDWLP